MTYSDAQLIQKLLKLDPNQTKQAFQFNHDLLNLTTNPDHDQRYLKPNQIKQFNLIRQFYRRCNQESLTTEQPIQINVMTEKLSRYFHALDHEELIVLATNASAKIIDRLIVNIGTANQVPINIQRITKFALLSNAQGIIIAHNHPDQNQKPSNADNQTVLELHQALSYFKIQLLDSLVFTDQHHYSYMKSGLLNALLQSKSHPNRQKD